MQKEELRKEPGTRRENRLAKKKERRQAMLEWIRELAIAVVIVLIIKNFVFSIITVQGGSMLDTLHTGDRLYVSILTPKLTGYERGDVVICYYPGRTDRCVKRIIAMPGETIEIVGGNVFVNGSLLEEDYLTYYARYYYPLTTLGDDEYFVLGDNRPISHDSHSSDVGPVTRLEGKVRFILWPFTRFGSVE